MNINAEIVGYVYLIWFPIYLSTLVLIQKGSQYHRMHVITGVVIYPFIILTPIYLILLALFRKEQPVEG